MSPFEELLGCQARGAFDLMPVPSRGEDTIRPLISTAKERYASLCRNIESKTREMVEKNIGKSLDVKFAARVLPGLLKKKKGKRFFVLDDKTGLSR